MEVFSQSMEKSLLKVLCYVVESLRNSRKIEICKIVYSITKFFVFTVPKNGGVEQYRVSQKKFGATVLRNFRVFDQITELKNYFL